MFIRTPFCSLLACAIAMLFFSADAAHGQRRQIRIGGQNGVVIGGGQGVVIGGSRGVQFGGGQGARFGPAGRGVQFGSGQGLVIGSQYGIQPQFPQVFPARQQQYGVSPQSPFSNGQPGHIAANGVPSSGNPTVPGAPLHLPRSPSMNNGNVPVPRNQAARIEAPKPELAKPASLDRRVLESNRNSSQRLNNERAIDQRVSRATFEASPAVVNQPTAITLYYPSSARRSLSYTVNGSDFQLAPGNSLRMKYGQTWNIGVVDGAGKRRQYLLDETKEYVLKESGSGWILDANEVPAQGVPAQGVPAQGDQAQGVQVQTPNPVVAKPVPAWKPSSTAPVKSQGETKAKTQNQPNQPKSVLEFNDSK